MEKTVTVHSSQAEGTCHMTWGPGGGMRETPESVRRWREGRPGNESLYCGFCRKELAKWVDKAYDCSWNNFSRLWGHRGCLKLSSIWPGVIRAGE